MKLHCLLLATVFLVPLPTARAQDHAVFVGRWTGDWKNSLGDSGKSTLDLNRSGPTRFSGTWDGVPVSGRRTNPNSVELDGRTKARSYRITLTVRNGTMDLTYIVTRLDSSGSYTGSSTLRRDR